MTFSAHTIFLALAALCFLLKAVNAQLANIDLLALGFFFVVLAFLF